MYFRKENKVLEKLSKYSMFLPQIYLVKELHLKPRSPQVQTVVLSAI
jgi:hypothetical protein